MVGNLKTNVGLVDKVSEGLQHSARNQSHLLQFSKYMLDELKEEDCESLSQETILGVINDAYQYIQRRPSNAHKIRAYDIKTEVLNNGVNETRTIIEILNDDMPFLVDSIMGELTEQQLTTYVFLHPILHITRDKSGELSSVIDGREIDLNVHDHKPEGYIKESYIQIQIEAISDQRKKDIVTTISAILESVRLAVADWRAMLLKITDTSTFYTESPPPVDVIKLTESIQFLKWLTDNHFTFLGVREYQLLGGIDNGFLKPIDGAALGVLRDPSIQPLKTSGDSQKLTAQSRKFLQSEEPLIITKANIRSTIHRKVHLDYIGIKTYDSSGEVSGELCVVGLFTSAAYTQQPKHIPFLRHKVETVIRRYGQPSSSHGSKILQNVLDTFPRDELFQINIDQLYETAIGILALDLKPVPKVFLRMDEFKRFASILVFVPRDCFSTETRIAVGEYLAKSLGGRVSAFFPFFLEGPMVRIHFIIGLTEQTPQFDINQLELDVTKILRSWRDELKSELAKHFLTSKAGNLLYKYGKAFPAGYEELTPPMRAIKDIELIEGLSPDRPIAINFYRKDSSAPHEVCVMIYHLGGPISLSDRVPILENMGFAVVDERTFKVSPSIDDNPAEVVNLHDMVLKFKYEQDIDLRDFKRRLEDGFLAVWNGQAEDDLYNNLLSLLNITWQEVSVVRAIGSFIRQLGEPFSRRYLAHALVRHHALTTQLVELFRVRCDPELKIGVEDRKNTQNEIVDQIEQSLVEIPSLDEDRIIRLFLDLITAIMRTSFYQKDVPETIGFKFDSRNIDAVPSPKPYAEIFVYSPRVEGVHLRGGKIARGGLRWSDRLQDYRTEILGLAKAQQVKNTVIVPAGAKGGFVCKLVTDDATRKERLEEGIACYKLFVSSLLSLTDNIDGDKEIRPENVICYDEFDPYLVVAADKGTATFSDIANKISLEGNFWLGDAFASGGSAGYDHKKMGITARGAWESVKRHFREMDRDIQNEPFAVVGVGDMSGDVFGNGMLLSKSIKLVAAFDHRDIFIDPTPQNERSWVERKRLFEMERSSWQDYDRELISNGGGVFSRQSKSIELSEEIKVLTGLTQDRVTPNNLIQALLKAEVDLLWFGGIGTYVRADDERDDEVGDRTNDGLRIQSSELNALVVGEGANLAMTHKARIAYAMKGGKVNSDAIDNSAGVNSSDLEVNIKIALGERVRSGLMTIEERNKLLASMTEEVAEACLANNYLQSLTISLGERRGLDDMSFQKRLMIRLEKSNLLDRNLEYLPSDSQIKTRVRNGHPLTRPELAILLAYAKIDLFNHLVESNVPDDEFLQAELLAYFPETLVNVAQEDISRHRLRREIIATSLSNAMINRGGSTMVVRLKEVTGYKVEDIAYAFIAARAVFDLESVYGEIDTLDNKVSGELQLSLYTKVQDILRTQTNWFLHNSNLSGGLAAVIEAYKNGLQKLDQSIEDILDAEQIDELQVERQSLEDEGISVDIAAYIAGLKFLSDGPDIILVSLNSGRDIVHSAKTYLRIDGLLHLRELRLQTSQLGHGDYFDRVAVNSALRDISEIQRQVTEEILNKSGSENLEDWVEGNRANVERAQQLISDIVRSDEITVAKLTVAVAQLRQLC